MYFKSSSYWVIAINDVYLKMLSDITESNIILATVVGNIHDNLELMEGGEDE